MEEIFLFSIFFIIILVSINSDFFGEASQHYQSSKFNEYLSKHKLNLKGSDEYQKRLDIYLNNLNYISSSNANKQNTFILGETRFTHLTFDEFRLGLQSKSPTKKVSNYPSNTNKPSSSTLSTKSSSLKPFNKPPSTSPIKTTTLPTKKTTSSFSNSPSTKSRISASKPPSIKPSSLYIKTNLPTKKTTSSNSPSTKPKISASKQPSLKPSNKPSLTSVKTTSPTALFSISLSTAPIITTSLTPSSKPASFTFPSNIPTISSSLFPSTTTKFSSSQSPLIPSNNPSKNINTSFDWTTNILNSTIWPIRDQGICQSCWSFAAVASIEAAYYIKYGSMQSFSTQYLVSCENDLFGCGGGDPVSALRWIQKNKGLPTAAAYPYISTTTIITPSCMTGYILNPLSTPSMINLVKSKSDIALQNAIKINPVIVYISSGQPIFQFYISGVINSVSCGLILDHVVVAVGYGNMNGINYIKIRNQWGINWGIKGYALIGSDPKKNFCGILTYPLYPTL